MNKIQRILIHLKTGQKFFIKNINQDFYTSYGTIKSNDLESKDVLESSKQEKFIAFSPQLPDLWENLQRTPQILLSKDIGCIIAKTGVNKESRIVDAGGGSGALCFTLAAICKEIVVYEINQEHYQLLLKNKQLFEYNNINIKKQDVNLSIAEKDIDLITLDLPEPWKVLSQAEKALKPGGFLVAYLPNLLQVKQFVQSTKETTFHILETIELLERKWKIEEKIIRPEFEMLGHTGFLTFCRRL